MRRRFWALSCLGFILFTPALGGKGLKAGESKLDLTQRYLILATGRVSTMQKELNQAAAAGYRVLAGWSAAEVKVTPHSSSFNSGQHVMLLEKAGTPPGTYEYLFLATLRSSTLQKEFKEAAARGFRLFPYAEITDKSLLMERAPGSTIRYDYLLLPHEFTNIPGRENVATVSLENINLKAAMQGYAIVGMSCHGGGEAFPSHVEHVFIAEKPVQPDSEVGQDSANDTRERYLILASRRGTDLQAALSRGAEQGYRLRLASDFRCPETVLIMEKVPQTGQPYQYLVVSGQDQLSAAAAQGFYPHPAGILGRSGIIMEKAPDSQEVAKYFFVEKTNSSDLQEQLTDAGVEGLNVVATSRSAHMVILQKTGGQVVESRVPEVRIPQPGADSTLPPPAASDDKRLEQLKQSGEALKEMMDLPEGLPQEVLDKAVCVMVVPSSGKPRMRERLGARTAPTGPLSCRSGQDFTGPWSAPSIFRLDGQGGPPRSSGYPATDIVNLLLVMFAPEAAPDLILLVMSPQGAETILKGQVRLGAHVTAGRGPKRGTANLALPQVLGYVRTSDGLFIGSSPEGLILGQDEAANKGLYGREISAWDIVRGGAVPLPAAGQDLIDTLSRHTREAALQSVAGEISNSQAAPAEAPRPDAVAPPPSRSVLSGDETGIPPGSKVYIYPMGGFESYLIAAIRKKKLPLVVAIEPDGVDFEISGSTTLHGQSAATGALGKIGSISAAASGEEAGDFPRKWEVNVKVRNVHTGAVILDRSVTKRSTARALPHYQQSAAQECADQLKKQIREPGPH